MVQSSMLRIRCGLHVPCTRWCIAAADVTITGAATAGALYCIGDALCSPTRWCYKKCHASGSGWVFVAGADTLQDRHETTCVQHQPRAAVAVADGLYNASAEVHGLLWVTIVHA